MSQPFARIVFRTMTDGSQAPSVVIPAGKDRPEIEFAVESCKAARELQLALENVSWVEVQS